MVIVFVKSIRTEETIGSVEFSSIESAETWIDAQMLIWEDYRIFEIMEK